MNKLLGLMLCCCSCATTGQGLLSSADSLSSEIAEIMVQHRAYPQAVPLLQRAMARDPNNGHVQILMGMVLAERGLLDEAEQLLRRGLTLAPNDAEGHSALGILYDRRGEGVLAERYHRQALERQPQRADLYNNLGFSCYLQGRYQEAMGWFRQALTRDPHLRRAYNNLGFTLARLGKFDQAQIAFDKGLSPADSYNNLGLAYEMMHEPEKAKQAYLQATKLQKDHPKARQNLSALTPDLPQ